MALENLLNDIHENEITASTGKPFYDRTYPVLLAVGEQIMAGNNNTGQARSILALGLAGWNRGFMGVDDYGRIIVNLNDRFHAVINSINQIINGQVAEQRPNLLENALMSACELLKEANRRRPATIAEPSKLLHFLAPNWLPILDSNVARELENNAHIGGGIATWELYIEYTTELWGLGFYGNHIPDGNLLMRYQRIANQAAPQVSALRVIDCTLFNRARPRA